MKISRKDLRNIIFENLLEQAGSPMAVEELIEQLVRGNKPINPNVFDPKHPLFNRIMNRGIRGSSGTVRTGQEAVAYMTQHVLPKVFKAQNIAPGSSNAAKYTLSFMESFGGPGLTAELAKILPSEGFPNYFKKILEKNPGAMTRKVIAKIGGVDDVIKGAQSAGALTKSAEKVSAALNTAITRPLRTNIPAKQVAEIIKQLDKSSLARNAATEALKDSAQLGTSTSANTAFKEVAEEAAKKGTKFAKFLRVLGPVGLMVNVLDAFYTPYNLFANGEFMGFKLGLGVSDMATPWGQLTYRRKKLKNPPAKPSDFNKEYKNLIAGLIWNQTKDPTAKEFVTTAIKEDLIDLPAWKEYLAPWREGEKKIKEATEEFAREEGEGVEGELIDGVDLSKIKATSEDTSSDAVKDDKGASKQTTAQKTGWERYIEKTKDKENAKKISEIWEEASKLPLINVSSDFAGFVAWYKKTKDDAETMKGLGKNTGDNFSPAEALRLIDAADSAVNEHFGKSHGTLIRERYRRY
jgi:hypothetical protein